MNKTFYNVINQDELNKIKNSNSTNPFEILGPHIWNKKLHIVSYIPNALKVEVLFDDNSIYEMESVDFEIFMLKTDFSNIKNYKLKIYYENSIVVRYDAYSFIPKFPKIDYETFSNDICTNAHKFLGSFYTKINGIYGTLFSVFAPMANRVSVVGDFNMWDGRLYQMQKISNNGIFSIFIPELKVGNIYKYEIRNIYGDVVLKSDPFSSYYELRPNTASIVYDDSFDWNDNEWIKQQKTKNKLHSPLNIYELHLGTFKKPNDKDFYNYRELAKLITDYIKSTNYTHVELLPVMEHPFDGSWGYQVTGYFAPTSRYGTPEDFKYFVNYLHANNIGVILDWVPAHFPKDAHGLAKFDGSCVYEHLNPLQGEHLQWGTLIFNYGRTEVKNFLLSSAFKWIEDFHIDGIRVDAVSSMLYLNFCKNSGQWIANQFGGNENLEAIEFLKLFNNIIEKKHKRVLRIAEESTAWQGVTHKDGLNFDFKWNMGWMNDFLKYIELDPVYRSHHQSALTFSFAYADKENYLLPISHDEVVHLKKSLLNKMPGNYDDKFANLRLALSFMMTHPGKKLLFMGQDIGEFDEWNEYRSVQWNLLDFDSHKMINNLVKDLNKLYLNNKALYYYDSSDKCFEWINGSYNNESLLFFARKATRKEDYLVIAANFTPVTRNNFKIGVKYDGEYNEIFNSDKGCYGGKNNINANLLRTKKENYDNYKYSLELTIPPLGVSILKFNAKK